MASKGNEEQSFLPAQLYDTPKPIGSSRPQYDRKYSVEWWSHAWDKKVARKFLPRIIYVITGFAIMGIWIGVIFNFAHKETKHQRSNASRDSSAIQSLNFSYPVIFQGNLRRFDPESRSLLVQWAAVLADDDTFTSFTPLANNESMVQPMTVYRDVKVIFNPDMNFTEFGDDVAATMFMLDNITAPRLGVVGAHPWDAIETEIDMAAATANDVWKEPLFGYPWDEWTGSIVFAMSYNSTSGWSADFPVGTTISGHILNWKIEGTSNFVPGCDIDAAMEEWVCGLQVNFTARRPGIVIFCVLAVVIVNWLSTIAIFLMTGEAILLRRSHILEGTDILGVCFAALFALPSVRSLLPGAPTEFGAVIDLIGILPNVVAISLCTAVFCAAKLNQRLQQAYKNTS